MASSSDRLLEGTTDAFLSLDLACRVTFANEPAHRLFSRLFHASLVLPSERSLWEVVPVLAESSLHQGCLQATRDQAPVEFEDAFEPSGAWLAVHIFPTAEGLSVFCRDVTELRLQRETYRLMNREREARAEADAARREAAQEREERDRALALLDAVLESTPLGYGILDPELRYLRVNQVLAEMNGFPAEAHHGKTVREVLPAFAPLLYPAMERVIQSGEPVSLQVEVPVPGGEPRHLTGSYFPVRNPDGELIAIAAHAADETEHVRRARLLEETAARFRTSVENLLSAFGIYSAIRDEAGTILDFRVEYVNDQACRANQMTREEQVGRSLLEILPGHRTSGLFDEYCEVVRTGRPLKKEALVYEDRYGTNLLTRAFDIQAAKLGDGFVATWRDTTEQRHSEEALRRSEARYRSLIQATAAIVWSTGPSGIFESEQPGWGAFTGQTPAQYLGPGGWDPVHPDDRDRSRAEWLASVRTRGPYVTEYRVRRHDGVYRTMLVRAVPILDDAGEILEWVGTHTDVTDRLHAEAALRQQEDQLRIALESARLGTWDYSPTTGTLEWSARCKAIFGLPEDAEMSYPRFLTLLHPDDRDWVDAVVSACIAPQSSGEYDIEYRVVWDDNSVHWVAAKGRGWFEGEGAARRCVRFIGTALDVTGPREAADALRESEERLRAALTASGTGTFRWDIRTNALEWDENLDRLFGLAPHETAQSLEQFLALVHPDDRNAVVERCVRCRDEGADFDLEFRVVWPDGTVHWLDDKGKTFLDEAGRSTYMTGACVDVTARKATAAALRESEERFRTLAEAVPQLVWVTRPDGWHEYYNQRWYDYTGTTPEETIGWGWITPLHPEDRARSQERWALATRTGEPYEIEYRLRSASGEYRWFLGQALPLRDAQGQITRWFGTCTDIHEQRLAQEERQRSLAQEQRRSRQLRLLADAALAVNAAATLDEMLHLLTRSALEIIGAQGCVIRIAGAGPAGEDVRVAAPQGAVRTDAATSHLAAALAGRDGAELGTIQLWNEGAGRFTEDDQSLLQQVAQMAAVAIEKMRLYEELRRADRAKTEFLAMLAHEIRNPMAPITNAVELLRAGATEERRERAQEVIRRQMRHMRRLVDDLLDVSRITQGKIELQRRMISLDTVVEQAVEAARPLIQHEGHTLQLRLPHAAVWLNADPDRLTQVLTNLLTNAAKYTAPGGEISLEADVSPDPDEVEIHVRDNGVGLAPGDLDRIFDLFAQVERDLARSQGGLGIGLTMVRNLVQMHGGRVTAHSAGPGQGSVFTVRLPVLSLGSQVPGPGSSGTVPVSEEPGVGNVDLGRGVLVIDDNTDGAETICELLQLWGYSCRVATSGAAGLELAQAYRPAAILLDLGLPGMDGFAVAAALRQLPEAAATRIVAVTGYGDEAIRSRTAAAGFDAHLTKPVDPNALRLLLQQL